MPALHALSSPDLTDSQVKNLFGSCSRLHGHDYRLEITLSGPCGSESGMLMRREDFDDRVKRVLIDRFRGTNLSDYFAFTTGEALAVEFFKLLSSEFKPPVNLLRVRVHETAKNSFISLLD